MSNNLYLAYGSNLNLEQMAERCPGAKVLGATELRNYRLLFRGGHASAVATVEPFKGGSVPVLVWSITPSDEAALDRYEGYPYLYRKETVKVRLGGKSVSAMIYLMNAKRRPLDVPGCYYYSVILEGYKSAGFNTNILKKGVRDSTEDEADE
jgi:gamma-glutamylcyclotransferase (GGCT)/AIG2-like uncharacterized protein YtfP